MPISRTIEQGECISSLSAAYGFFWSTIWNHADNADLKQLRKDPNALLEGDVVVIPDKTPKEESCSTEQKHKFKKKGTPAKIKIRLMLDDQPRKNEPYKLQIDGEWVKDGQTDGDGFLEVPIPPGARQGLLRVGSGERVDEYQLALGTLDPIDTDTGVKGRLHGLGYDCDGDIGPAISAFQKKEQLTVTGELDDQTRDKLKERFGQ